jgi:vacuolar-type H+-ATPase subunit F/Vma7
MSLQQKIHVVGYDEIVILMNLLGIEGTVLDDPNEFMDVFENLTEDKSINIIIISMNLPDKIIDYLIDFKLNNTKPFVCLMPDLFQEHPDDKSILLKKVYKKTQKLLI